MKTKPNFPSEKETVKKSFKWCKSYSRQVQYLSKFLTANEKNFRGKSRTDGNEVRRLRKTTDISLKLYRYNLNTDFNYLRLPVQSEVSGIIA